MRIARFVHTGQTRTGLVEGDGVVALPAGVDLARLLASGLEDLTTAVTAPVPLAALRLLAPLDPPTIRTAGPSVHDGQYSYREPVLRFGDPYAVIGPTQDVPLAPGSAALAVVPQLGAVVGRGGENLSPAQARRHIAGYLILNAWSVADRGVADRGVATTLGPWLVTADEFDRLRDGSGRPVAELTVTVNGAPAGTGQLASSVWRFEDLVALASRGSWVRPGDVIGAGPVRARGSTEPSATPGNVGAAGDPGSGWVGATALRVGDLVTVTVAGIGSTGNRVVPGPPLIAIPPPGR
jgi:2-keto-4-pentenoate hydratase/2-oxohepta-3-ene-1,7-dioic acid hydratase in catechol pathway